MKLTKSRFQVDKHKIVIFGAGKVGRSFIGQLFGCAGYKIVFADIDQIIVDSLNKQGFYRVIIKGETEEEIIVKNVHAISSLNTSLTQEAVSTAGIIAVSVGKNALEKVIPVIAAGLEMRFSACPDCPLDIIIAENMREAGTYMKEKLTKALPFDYPLERLVGLVETSIGKMVPIMTAQELEKDPTVVFAEPYNTLILDKMGFRSEIPDIKGLAPKENIRAWVDRKAFIHNLGHATAAYYGHYLHPEAVYMYEILNDSEVLRFTKDVMLQSANALVAAYPSDFNMIDLEYHINDLISRFRNKALRDTVFRVGQDLSRKLSADDRFTGAIHLAMKHRLPYNMILKAMSYGFCFRAKDENGKLSPSDVIFLEALSKEPEKTLIKTLFLDPETDYFLIEQLRNINPSLDFSQQERIDHSPKKN